MKDIAKLAVQAAVDRGVDYADARVVEQKDESLRVRNGSVDNLSSGQTLGFGVRVLASGAWGFASSSRVATDEVPKVVERAIGIARASARLHPNPVVLAPVQAFIDSYATPMERDPWSVPLDEKLGLLFEADKAMKAVGKDVITESSLHFFAESKVFCSSAGSMIEQKICESGGGISATAVGGGESQQRSYGDNYAKAGYEWIERLNLAEQGGRVAGEALALLDAKQCEPGTTTLVIDSAQMALQIHESCGHPVELDRVLGMEASFAGTSFLTLDKLGKFRYGSDIVNITADATIPGALGSFGYDDEGVPAQRIEVIKQGILAGYLTSRETAPVLSQASNGTMRADGWNRIPLIRMTNISLEPGEGTLADLISGVDRGLFISRNKSWSIDDRRLNFQFAAEIGWEIKNGRLGAMVKNPVYTGITPEFWGKCDGIAGPEEWVLWGIPNCGKGEPMQVAHVGHGSSPARFHDVKVGVGSW
ncbi:MAG: TldD/PmbA family protein [Chloroflexi bacterium]|nr:TldD/PmbA family protein [Chloroflexota bacterium]